MAETEGEKKSISSEGYENFEDCMKGLEDRGISSLIAFGVCRKLATTEEEQEGYGEDSEGSEDRGWHVN